MLQVGHMTSVSYPYIVAWPEVVEAVGEARIAVTAMAKRAQRDKTHPLREGQDPPADPPPSGREDDDDDDGDDDDDDDDDDPPHSPGPRKQKRRGPPSRQLPAIPAGIMQRATAHMEAGTQTPGTPRGSAQRGRGRSPARGTNTRSGGDTASNGTSQIRPGVRTQAAASIPLLGHSLLNSQLANPTPVISPPRGTAHPVQRRRGRHVQFAAEIAREGFVGGDAGGGSVAPITALDRMPTIPDPSPMQEAPGSKRQASASRTPRTLQQRQPHQETLAVQEPPRASRSRSQAATHPAMQPASGAASRGSPPPAAAVSLQGSMPTAGPPAVGGAQSPPQPAMQPDGLQDSTPSAAGLAVGGGVPSPAYLLPGVSVADMRQAYERAHGRPGKLRLAPVRTEQRYGDTSPPQDTNPVQESPMGGEGPMFRDLPALPPSSKHAAVGARRHPYTPPTSGLQLIGSDLQGQAFPNPRVALSRAQIPVSGVLPDIQDIQGTLSERHTWQDTTPPQAASQEGASNPSALRYPPSREGQQGVLRGIPMPAETLDSRLAYGQRPRQEQTGIPPTGPPAGMQEQQPIPGAQVPQLLGTPLGGPMGGQTTGFGPLRGVLQQATPPGNPPPQEGASVSRAAAPGLASQDVAQTPDAERRRQGKRPRPP